MELQIFKAIVHVLDSSGGAPVFSDRLLELDGDTADYLAAHLEKAYYNDAVKNCSFAGIHFPGASSGKSGFCAVLQAGGG